MADDLLPAYLLTGSDRPKIGRALRRLRTRFGDEAVELMGADTVSGEDVAGSLNSLGLFGAGRLVVVQGVERWKKADVEALDGYLADPVDGAVLALVADEPPKDDALGRLVARRPSALWTICSWSNAGSKPNRLNRNPPLPCWAPWQAPWLQPCLVITGIT